ncbi:MULTISPECIES: murein transglycosylase A [Nostoc]|uniref:peptidoglycan lytic exotransglycosylase n=2 Tax=Nostoc TaxID=1177 RepID=A0ABR8I2S5_9NOSO|nr:MULTISPECIES: MltA domain-containing protein [Nostoc]MBD2559658.1 MltA domain-containing protein [Nostoc linckia FACHB-391]MBD2645388.1 MltA domain-containing protein [Nostoc foliaceum FACHB-393]
MNKTLARLAKFNKVIAISLPVVLSILLVRMQSLTHQELSPPECRVKKWNIPVSLTAENQDAFTQKQKTPLIQRLPVTCCQDDPSCLDEVLYGEIPDKKALMSAIARSLQYLQTANAAATYQNYQVAGITRDRVIKSLKRFRELLLKTNSATELHQAIEREFVLYQSVGNDTKGSVLFTAYYEPLYAASRVPTAEYRYPVYRLPPDLNSWSKPHPTREELEGADGLQGAKGKLRGLELFWFRDRLEPYLAQIQGSARLQLRDGTQTTIGYAGNIAYNYKSIGRELANDGKLPLEGVTMPIILDYFQKHPQELNIYIPRDRSFVFFQENHGDPAQGSINVSLTAERSIATDKSLMPPGALALIRTSIPFPNPTGKMEERIVSRYVLDQDAGGAIKGAGRVDYFLGTGKLAGDRAGVTVSNGQLFYLLLKSNN